MRIEVFKCYIEYEIAVHRSARVCRTPWIAASFFLRPAAVKTNAETLFAISLTSRVRHYYDSLLVSAFCYRWRRFWLSRLHYDAKTIAGTSGWK